MSEEIFPAAIALAAAVAGLFFLVRTGIRAARASAQAESYRRNPRRRTDRIGKRPKAAPVIPAVCNKPEILAAGVPAVIEFRTENGVAMLLQRAFRADVLTARRETLGMLAGRIPFAYQTGAAGADKSVTEEGDALLLASVPVSARQGKTVSAVFFDERGKRTADAVLSAEDAENVFGLAETLRKRISLKEPDPGVLSLAGEAAGRLKEKSAEFSNVCASLSAGRVPAPEEASKVLSLEDDSVRAEADYAVLCASLLILFKRPAGAVMRAINEACRAGAPDDALSLLFCAQTCGELLRRPALSFSAEGDLTGVFSLGRVSACQSGQGYESLKRLMEQE